MLLSLGPVDWEYNVLISRLLLHIMMCSSTINKAISLNKTGITEVKLQSKVVKSKAKVVKKDKSC